MELWRGSLDGGPRWEGHDTIAENSEPDITWNKCCFQNFSIGVWNPPAEKYLKQKSKCLIKPHGIHWMKKPAIETVPPMALCYNHRLQGHGHDSTPKVTTAFITVHHHWATTIKFHRVVFENFMPIPPGSFEGAPEVLEHVSTCLFITESLSTKDGFPGCLLKDSRHSNSTKTKGLDTLDLALPAGLQPWWKRQGWPRKHVVFIVPANR